jgi:hypothetical protein
VIKPYMGVENGMPDWKQVLIAVLPVLGNTLSSAAQNWLKQDDVARSALHGLVGGVVTVSFAYLVVKLGGK